MSRALLDTAGRALARLLEGLTGHWDAAVVLLSADGCVRSWGRGAERVAGVARDDAVGAPLHSLLDGLPPGRLRAALIRVQSGHSVELELPADPGARRPAPGWLRLGDARALALEGVEVVAVFGRVVAPDLPAGEAERQPEAAAHRRLAVAVAHGIGADRILELVAEEAAQVLGAQSACVVRFQDGDAGIVVSCWTSDPRVGLPPGSRVPPDSIVNEVQRTGRAMRLGPPAPDSRYAAAADRAAAPISVAGSPWGAVVLADTRPGVLPEDAPARLQAFAELVAVAISEAERRAEIAADAARQATLNRLGARALISGPVQELFDEVVRSIGEAVDADLAAVLELAPGDDALTVAAIRGADPQAWLGARLPASSENQAAATLRSSVPVIVANHRVDARFAPGWPPDGLSLVSGVTTPIASERERLGVLAAHRARRPLFSRAEVRFLQAAAQIVAGAIQRQRFEDALAHGELHDALTGLPNRALFVDRLQHAGTRAAASGGTVAVVLIDLDDFGMVNETHGTEVADRLLQTAAGRLVAVVEDGDTVARVGSDEFAVIFETDDADAAAACAERVLDELSCLMPADGAQIATTVSVGVAVAEPGRPAHALLREATAAAARAKHQGRGRYAVFDPKLQRRAWRTATLRHELAGALAEDRLVLHYQPIVRLEDGQIVSFEALVRWDHPERGLLAPVEFVPLAEQSPLIHDLGARVLDMACATAKRWRVELQRPVPVAVNLSPAQLARDGVVDALAERVRVCGASLTDISLELTETVLIESSAGSRVVHALADTGFKLVLDDFGAGFSSLSYLHRFPFSTIKLDRSFIAALGTEAPVKAIIEGVVGIASAIGSDVVAEGVERPDQRAALLEIGCQLAQGYLFSRPVTEEAAAALLSQGPITGGSTR